MKKRTGLSAIILAVALLACGCGSKGGDDLDSGDGGGSPAASAVKGTASVSGKVVLNGKAPAAAKLDMAADPVCKSQHSGSVKNESVLQNADGTLQNVFVYVKEGAGKFPAPSSPVVLDQKGCQYVPHVVGVQVGQTLQISNSDSTLHNVHAMPTLNDGFNLGQPTQGMKSDRAFTKPEVMVKMKCDVHSWMSSYVGVVPHPFFAVTGSAGTFSVKELPAGSYTLEAWHEKYGTAVQKVDLKDGEAKSVDFTFNAN